jgi:hypothetical protein
MFMPLVTGDSATERPEYTMTCHVARERARGPSRQTTDGMSRWANDRPDAEQHHDCKQYIPYWACSYGAVVLWNTMVSVPALMVATLPLSVIT